MKLLIMTGPIWPALGHNANLMAKLLPFFSEQHDISILTYLPSHDPAKLPPSEFRGFPLYCAVPKNDFREQVLFRTEAKLFDRNGYSDLCPSKILARYAAGLLAEQHFDAILASTGPFEAMNAAAMQSGVARKYLYMMDPPDLLCGRPGTPYRNRRLRKILNSFDRVFTTKYAHSAFAEQGFSDLRCQFTELGFPMMEPHSPQPLPEHITMPHDKVNLLFCGTMNTTIRSPAYYLKLAEHLDERFRLYFVGWGCDTLTENSAFHTRAEVIALPQQPYSTALSMLHHADVLIIIGNQLRVHLPSKVLEYMSFCKPIVNFYKFEDCPSLDYTRRYPFCLDISEQEPLTPEVVSAFQDFCLSNRGKTVDYNFVSNEFFEFRPDYIANVISNLIG